MRHAIFNRLLIIFVLFFDRNDFNVFFLHSSIARNGLSQVILNKPFHERAKLLRDLIFISHKGTVVLK